MEAEVDEQGGGESLALDEDLLASLPEANRPVHVYTWLKLLNSRLPTTPRAEIKVQQQQLVGQLMVQVKDGSCGPPARQLLASALATLFSVGDTFLLFETINKCNDLLKTKDDSPAFLPCRLTATVVVGAMYEKLGRMMGRSYEETVSVLTKGLKNAESLTRVETMVTLGKVCKGLGGAASNVHKDMYKAARGCLSDRAMTVRLAAAECLLQMIDHCPWMAASPELDNLARDCFRAMEGANHAARGAVARLLGQLVASTQESKGKRQGMFGPSKPAEKGNKSEKSLEEALSILSQGFLRGGPTSSLLKGSSSVSQELRVGLSHTYVAMTRCLGPTWLERHLSTILNHLLELAASPRAGGDHTECVLTRNCLTFILSHLVGRQLREKAQLTAAKELVAILAKSLGAGSDEGEGAHHLQVVALTQVGSLASRLGTVTTSLLTDSSLRLLDTVFSGLLHPKLAVRLAAAACLRQVCVAVPSVLTPLTVKCGEALESYKGSQEAVSGYSAGLAALLGAVSATPNGIPHTRGKIIFNCGEELIRSAGQTQKAGLSEERTRAGWLLIGAIMSLGSSVVRGLLPRCMLLWRNAFPRSRRELESERARGDAFTWVVSLEARAGALATIHSFIVSCPDLVTEDIIRRLTVPLEKALDLLAWLEDGNSPLKSYNGALVAPAATVRLRLLEVVASLPPSCLESHNAALLKLLASVFCPVRDSTAPTSTSLLASVCHQDDLLLLGGDIPDKLETFLEEQLQPLSAAGSIALEHDPCWLYRRAQPDLAFPDIEPGAGVGGKDCDVTAAPLPLGVSVVDQSIIVFGRVFPRAAPKHRHQILNYFTERLKSAKAGKPLEVLQTNIFAALLCGLRGLSEGKSVLGSKELVNVATSLITGQLTAANPALRCAAGESLGRMAQVVQDNKYIAERAQHSVEFLKTARDVASRTGHSFALCCLHRYVGSLGSSQHLATSVSILLALAQDSASPVVQAWALHALAVIADSGGPMFRDCIDSALSCTLRLLLSVPATQTEVLVSLGKLLAAIITTLGPELAGNGNGVARHRSDILLAAGVLQTGGPAVQAEALACLQQLHMFAPTHLDLGTVVPELVALLTSPHLSLRRAAVACLRQLAQREAREVCEIAFTLGNQGVKDTHCVEGIMAYSDSGLPGMLFSLLDQEEDEVVMRHAQQTITSILVTMAATSLSTWLRLYFYKATRWDFSFNQSLLSLCKEVLTVSVDAAGEISGVDDREEDDDNAEFTHGEDSSAVAMVQPRWGTRVFAAVCLRKIIQECCEGDRAHFDLCLAKEVALAGGKGDYLVLHLSELVRMCFMAATSDSDPLRLEGLRTMQVVIDRFAETTEPEFPGHVILEQYQAQVGAALRPAFAPDTASHVTATACAVCSTWISSGVARELSDLRRVYQLLVSSLSKLKKGFSSGCYNESSSTLEKLSILKAWAEVYIVSMASTSSTTSTPSDDEDFGDFEGDDKGEEEAVSEEASSLTGLVASELASLSKHWLAALKDHALLSLSNEFKSQLPYEGGAFYTMDTIELAKPHYKSTWAAILAASATWLSRGGGFDNVSLEKTELDVTGSANIGLGPANATSSADPEEINRSRFHLLLGVSMEALCSPRTGELTPAELAHCLQALASLLKSPWARVQLVREEKVLVELCNVLHRQLLSQDGVAEQIAILEVLSLAVLAAQEDLAAKKKLKMKDLFPANQSVAEEPAEVSILGEGGDDGNIKAGNSVAFAILEVCLCVIVRYHPSVSPRAAQSSSVLAMQARSRARSSRGCQLSEEQQKLVSRATSIVATVPSLCSPQGAVTVMPTCLYLITGVLKEAASKLPGDITILADSPMVVACLEALKLLVGARYPSLPEAESRYHAVSHSGLLRVLDLAKTAPQEAVTDEVSLLLAIKVYLTHGVPELLAAPDTRYPAVNAFSSSLQSTDIEVQIRCLALVCQICRESPRPVALPYIQALSPQVIQWCLGPTLSLPTSQAELSLALGSLDLLDCLLALSLEGKQGKLLNLSIPVLIHFLVDDTKKQSTETVSTHKMALHEAALERLTKLGRSHPKEFKEILGSNQDMSERVKRAAVAASQRTKAKQQASVARAAVPAQPSITLKMDFSNFK